VTAFVLFLDGAGAEITNATVTRKEVFALNGGQIVRFKPLHVRPIEVIGPGSNPVKGAAIGFVLLGPVGAAVGALLGTGPKVQFEIECDQGRTYKGVCKQADYPKLRRSIEATKRYKSGDVARSFGWWSALILTMLLFTAGGGPVGFVIGMVMFSLINWAIAKLRGPTPVADHR
jgi:hypothetical protein